MLQIEHGKAFLLLVIVSRRCIDKCPFHLARTGRGEEHLLHIAMRHIHPACVEVLVVSRNFYTALPSAGAEEIVRTRIIDHATVDSKVIIMESLVHGSLCSAGPHPVFVFAEHCAATATQSETYDDRLGIGSHHTESRIPFGVDLRILLSGLVERVGPEVLFRSFVVEFGIEIAEDVVRPFRLVVLVEHQRVVVHAEPGVAVAQVPERNIVDYVLVLAEDTEDTVVLILLECSDIRSLRGSLAS